MTKVEAMMVWINGAKRDKKMAEDSFVMKHYEISKVNIENLWI